jgi:hypothetical protein
MLWVRLSLRARCATSCDKVCDRWLAAGQWFSPGSPVSSTIKTDRHDITEILLKVALNTIKPTNQPHENDVRFVFNPICDAESSFYLCFLYLFTYTGAQHDLHVKWCPCLLTVTQWVSLVEQELLTLPEHLSWSPILMGFVLLDL